MTDAVQRAKRYSKASVARLEAMANALYKLDAQKIEGDVVECGVWQGGHIVLARLISPKRRCWLYDTFEGMTEPGPHDVKRSGNKPPPDKAKSKKWTMASLEEVEGNLQREGLYDADRLRFIVGDVCLTLLNGNWLPNRIALLRLDTDWYASTKIELETLWPRLVPGGVMIVDDYGHWMGAKKAVDEYFSVVDPRVLGRLMRIDYTGVWVEKR